jgi:hypothetical protein
MSKRNAAQQTKQFVKKMENATEERIVFVTPEQNL